jgi:hypothetical protein
VSLGLPDTYMWIAAYGLDARNSAAIDLKTPAALVGELEAFSARHEMGELRAQSAPAGTARPAWRCRDRGRTRSGQLPHPLRYLAVDRGLLLGGSIGHSIEAFDRDTRLNNLSCGFPTAGHLPGPPRWLHIIASAGGCMVKLYGHARGGMGGWAAS